MDDEPSSPNVLEANLCEDEEDSVMLAHSAPGPQRPGGGGVVASPWFACTLIEASRSALGVPWCLATFSPGLDAMPICVCGQGVRRTALRWERGTIPLFKQLTHLYA